MTDTQALVERLRAKRKSQLAFGSGSISVDASGNFLNASVSITDDGMRLVNPDGREAADALERMAAEVEVLRAHVSALVTLAIDGGLTHDLVAQLYPEAKKSNGQPACDFAKRAQRAINEARQALSDRGRG